MIIPKLPTNEAERLNEVKKYNLLDTLPEKQYDNITSLVASICDTPISLITLLDFDRNFLKSHFGVQLSESPRDISFCGHAIISQDEVFIVEDAREDIRFHDNPLIEENGVIFYAGAPLINEKGFPLGTLCVYDVKPRVLTEKQINMLKLMAKQVVNLFELHLKNQRLLEIQQEQRLRNERLQSFARVVSHDLKSPLANITSLSQMLKEENKDSLPEESLLYLNYIEESTLTLKNYIDGMLQFYKSTELLEQQKNSISVVSLFEEIKEMLILNKAEFVYPKDPTTVHINKPAISQILLNLVDNAFKFNAGDGIKVQVTFSEATGFYIFTVEDNGMGIPKDKQDDVFEIFKTGGIKDRNGKEGTGIGLATVKNLVNKLGGEITLESEIGKGSIFTFTIKK